MKLSWWPDLRLICTFARRLFANYFTISGSAQVWQLVENCLSVLKLQVPAYTTKAASHLAAAELLNLEAGLRTTKRGAQTGSAGSIFSSLMEAFPTAPK